MPHTNKRVGILLQAEVCDEVGCLVGGPLHYVSCGAALAVSRVGEGGGRVLGAERPRACRRAFVLSGDSRAV